MAKPKVKDRFDPKGCKPNDAWSHMEEWGGKSWFPAKEEKGVTNGRNKSNTKRPITDKSSR